MSKTIWELIERQSRYTIESLKLRLVKVEQIEDEDLFLATFEGHIADDPKLGRYEVTWVYRITDGGEVRNISTETVEPTDKLEEEEEETDEEDLHQPIQS